jgi:alkyl hydroperoxide reductase subunit AhpF
MPDKLLHEPITTQIRDLFDAQLVDPVEIFFFSKDESCQSCEDSRQLLEEVTSISDKLRLNTYNSTTQSPLSHQLKNELMPGFVITGRDGDKYLDFGLIFAGIPSGYEFSSLIQGIILASKRDSGLKPEIREALKGFTHPVNLKVFVTPT